MSHNPTYPKTTTSTLTGDELRSSQWSYVIQLDGDHEDDDGLRITDMERDELAAYMSQWDYGDAAPNTSPGDEICRGNWTDHHVEGAGVYVLRTFPHGTAVLYRIEEEV